MSEWIGKMLGKVRIDSLLARGGMAEVYLGEHVALQREVAVKILRNQYEDDPDLLERFQREARVVAKLRHSNIVQVFDYDTVESHPYLVMEYIPGISLSRYLSVLHGRNGRLELPVISRIITQVAHALEYAHESGVIHRDVKPGNILLTSRSEKVAAGKPLPGDFEPILTDFGLVKFLDSRHHTTTGTIAGTPAYMSPEQARGDPTDGRTDIYSLGIVLYELLSGHVPFDGETTMSIIFKHVSEPPAPIPGLTSELQDVLDRALAKKPDDRFQTPNEFARSFNAVIRTTTDSETLLESNPHITDRITKKVGYRGGQKKAWTRAIFAGTLVMLLGGFILFKDRLLPAAPIQAELPTSSASISVTENIPTSTSIPPSIVHFQDGAGILDQISLSAKVLVAPPEGSHYEVWLADGGEWRSIGILLLDSSGAGKLVNNDPAKANMLSLYDQVYVSIEFNSDIDASPSNLIAYSASLPVDGLNHLRHLLVSFSDAPQGIALVQGLNTGTKLIEQLAKDMQTAYGQGDASGARKNAEAILNIQVGDLSADHKDWNGDGQVTDPGDGFGLVPNGSHAGYIQAVYSHADSAFNSLDATQSMTMHGTEVKTCTQNIADWNSKLRDMITTIVSSPAGTDLSQPILDSVKLADQMLNGIDANGDKRIDAMQGECGMSSLYGYAYSMADMTLLPFNSTSVVFTETPTATLTVTSYGNGSSGNGSSGSGNTPAPATKKPNPTRKPTKTPKP